MSGALANAMLPAFGNSGLQSLSPTQAPMAPQIPLASLVQTAMGNPGVQAQLNNPSVPWYSIPGMPGGTPPPPPPPASAAAPAFAPGTLTNNSPQVINNPNQPTLQFSPGEYTYSNPVNGTVTTDISAMGPTNAQLYNSNPLVQASVDAWYYQNPYAPNFSNDAPYLTNRDRG